MSSLKHMKSQKNTEIQSLTQTCIIRHNLLVSNNIFWSVIEYEEIDGVKLDLE